MPVDQVRNLRFVEKTPTALAAAIGQEAEIMGRRSVAFVGQSDQAADIRALLEQSGLTVAEPGTVPLEGPVLVLGDDGPAVAATLMGLLNCRSVRAVAPITDRYWRNKGLFIVTIPKSGSHLLMRLVKMLGYAEGGECPRLPQTRRFVGRWYTLEYSNAHTAAPDFFIDTVRRSPFGNRDHPFSRNPTLFMYRDPQDILLSEARYYHVEGKTSFAGYLSQLDLEERLLRLVDDPWLLGSIRDRIGKFIAWADFPNVIPVSFEELVGPDGGGDRTRQLDLLWSLLLKLQVDGDPAALSQNLFDPDSPTFTSGRLGGHKRLFTPAVRERFDRLPQDFMKALGYGSDDSPFSRRCEEFRCRPLHLSTIHFQDEPILEGTFLEHNIVRFRNRFLGLHVRLGPTDLTVMDDAGLSRFPSGHTVDELQLQIIKSRLEPTTTHFQDEPILEGTFLEHNIVRFRDRFWGLHVGLGPTDLTTMDDADLTRLPGGHTVGELQLQIIKNRLERG